MGDEQLYLSRMTTKGQITVPQELRKFLELKEGDYVLFVKKENTVEISKLIPPKS